MKSLRPMVAMIVFPLAMTAACKPGEESGKVYKVLEQDASSQASGGPQEASQDSSGAPNATSHKMRTAIFSFGNKRYSLLLPSSDSHLLNLSAGQIICLRKEDGAPRIVTEEGVLLPGVAQAVPRIPATKGRALSPGRLSK